MTNPIRHYLHGDIHEDGKRYYNARADSFDPLPAPEATAIDVDRYRRMKATFRPGAKIYGPGGTIGPSYRPDDAPNLYADHPLVTAHPKTLKAAVKKAYAEE